MRETFTTEVSSINHTTARPTQAYMLIYSDAKCSSLVFHVAVILCLKSRAYRSWIGLHKSWSGCHLNRDNVGIEYRFLWNID